MSLSGSLPADLVYTSPLTRTRIPAYLHRKILTLFANDHSVQFTGSFTPIHLGLLQLGYGASDLLLSEIYAQFSALSTAEKHLLAIMPETEHAAPAAGSDRRVAAFLESITPRAAISTTALRNRGLIVGASGQLLTTAAYDRYEPMFDPFADPVDFDDLPADYFDANAVADAGEDVTMNAEVVGSERRGSDVPLMGETQGESTSVPAPTLIQRVKSVGQAIAHPGRRRVGRPRKTPGTTPAPALAPVTPASVGNAGGRPKRSVKRPINYARLHDQGFSQDEEREGVKTKKTK